VKFLPVNEQKAKEKLSNCLASMLIKPWFQTVRYTVCMLQCYE